MNTNIKVAVFGGTGKSGKYLIRQLTSKGVHIKMLIRNSSNFTISDSLIEAIEGDAYEYSAVQSVIDGCQAIISTLGFSVATQHVLKAMKECKVHRYILLTGLNVDVPSDNKSGKTKFATDWMYENYPKMTADRQLEYSFLSESDSDWTLVRLPMIDQTDETNKVAVNLHDCPGDKISATDLAQFLIEQLEDNRYFRQAPFIANI